MFKAFRSSAAVNEALRSLLRKSKTTRRLTSAPAAGRQAPVAERTFALYPGNADGSGLERVTYGETFASFPMFSRDGAKLVFCGSRNGSAPRDLNVFMADWAA